MKKKSLLSYMILGGLMLVMTMTTALSYAYWKSGVEGNSRDKGLNIVIGEGDAYLTTVDLSEATNLKDGMRLVPSGRVTDSLTQTNQIEFEIDVTWSPAESQLPSSTFPTTQGLLTVKCTRIFIQGEPDIELLETKGYGGYNLFNVSTNQISYDILGEATEKVTVRVSMNEPKDREQYELIAGQSIKISLEFRIQSPDDLSQQID